METKEVFSLEIIINVLVSYFRLIWIPMLWVYGHYKYSNSFSVTIVFIRQHLTSTDVRCWRIKTFPALKELKRALSGYLTLFPPTYHKCDLTKQGYEHFLIQFHSLFNWMKNIKSTIKGREYVIHGSKVHIESGYSFCYLVCNLCDVSACLRQILITLWSLCNQDLLKARRHVAIVSH